MKKRVKRVESGVFDAKLFVSPWIVATDILERTGFDAEQAEAQRKLEEGALFARWTRKHKAAGN